MILCEKCGSRYLGIDCVEPGKRYHLRCKSCHHSWYTDGNADPVKDEAMSDGTEGQDRESYSDDQDRESYVPSV